MALQKSLLRIDEESLFETFCSLKIRNFGYTSELCLIVSSIGTFYYRTHFIG